MNNTKNYRLIHQKHLNKNNKFKKLNNSYHCNIKNSKKSNNKAVNKRNYYREFKLEHHKTLIKNINLRIKIKKNIYVINQIQNLMKNIIILIIKKQAPFQKKLFKQQRMKYAI